MRVLIDLTALGIVARFRSESCIEIIIEADFYFHTSLCASKHFEAPQRSVKIKA